MAKLSYARRKQMPKNAFVFPGKKTAANPAGQGGYPIPDKAHARNALARVSQFGSSAQKTAVRSKVKRKFPGIGARVHGSGPFSAADISRGYRVVG